jgi:hypothetical protein
VDDKVFTFAYYSPMGGERSGTTSKRLAGAICCNCKNFLPPPHKPGEQWCAACKPPVKMVYMSFERMEGWRVVFFDSYTQQRLRVMNFQDGDNVIELARRGGALTNLEAKHAIEKGISNGKGGVFLKLSIEQYDKLK